MSICTLWRWNCCYNHVSTKQKQESGRNSRTTSKPGRRGRRPSRKHTSRRDATKQPERERKTLWWFRSIRWFSRKENKQSSTEARKYNVRGASPADKSDDGLARGVPGQYFCGGHTNCRKRRTTRGVSGKSGDLSWHCRATAARNKASIQTDQRFEKRGTQAASIGKLPRRRTGDDNYMHTLWGGLPYCTTQKECMLLRPAKYDRPKGVGLKTDGQEGRGVQRWWITVGYSAKSNI